MEKYQAAQASALKNLKVADHILHVTFPLLQDPKLLVGVLHNVFLALTQTMTTVLLYDRYVKLIPPFHDTFESKFNMFRVKSMQEHKIDEKYAKLIQEIKELIVLHRKSTVEFRRKDSFIICQDDFSSISISAAQLKEYVKTTKEFVALMDVLVNKHERISGRSTGRIKAC